MPYRRKEDKAKQMRRYRRLKKARDKALKDALRSVGVDPNNVIKQVNRDFGFQPKKKKVKKK